MSTYEYKRIIKANDRATLLNLMIGLTTPPVGMCICTGAQIGGVSSWKAFKANMPFLITSLIVLMLVSFCEPITLWIPSLFA